MAKRFTPEFQLESAKLVLDQNYTPTEAANAMDVGVSTMTMGSTVKRRASG